MRGLIRSGEVWEEGKGSMTMGVEAVTASVGQVQFAPAVTQAAGCAFSAPFPPDPSGALDAERASAFRNVRSVLDQAEYHSTMLSTYASGCAITG